MPTVACIGCLRGAEGGVDTTVGEAAGFSELNGLLAGDIDVSAANFGVPEPGVSASTFLASPASDFGVNVLPHWGQKAAGTRRDTPQEVQRRAISGSAIVGISDFGLRIADFMNSSFESSIF
jgi:hypothetical protein